MTGIALDRWCLRGPHGQWHALAYDRQPDPATRQTIVCSALHTPDRLHWPAFARRHPTCRDCLDVLAPVQATR